MDESIHLEDTTDDEEHCDRDYPEEQDDKSIVRAIEAALPSLICDNEPQQHQQQQPPSSPPAKRKRVEELTPHDENALIASEICRLRALNSSLRHSIDECTKITYKLMQENAVLQANCAQTATINKTMRSQNVELNAFATQQAHIHQQTLVGDENSAMARCVLAQRILKMFKQSEKDGYTRIIKNIFTETQMRLLQGQRDVKWPKQDIYVFSLLYEYSPAAYSFLQDVYKYPLPHPNEFLDVSYLNH